MARQLAQAADARLRAHLPSRTSLARMIREWEAGRARPRDPYPVLYARAFGMDEADLFADSPRTASPGPVPPPLTGDGPVDGEYVVALRRTGQALVALDSRYGGDGVAPLALRAFRAAGDRLASGRVPARIERDVEAATGELGEIAAWQAHDADRQDISRQVIHEALLLSRLAGDRDMELFELAHLSMLSLCRRRPREALRVADDVLEWLGLSPRVVAVFDVRRARALAHLGDGPRALDAIERARCALAGSVTTRDPGWTWWMDDAELSWHEGMVRAELGDWRKAIGPLTLAASRRTTRGRSRYHYAAQLLNALVHAGAWQEAEPVIADVLEQAPEVGSAWTARLLRDTAERAERARPPSALGDAARRLRCVLRD